MREGRRAIKEKLFADGKIVVFAPDRHASDEAAMIVKPRLRGARAPRTHIGPDPQQNTMTLPDMSELRWRAPVPAASGHHPPTPVGSRGGTVRCRLVGHRLELRTPLYFTASLSVGVCETQPAS